MINYMKKLVYEMILCFLLFIFLICILAYFIETKEIKYDNMVGFVNETLHLCHLNTSLQILFTVDEFTQILKNNRTNNDCLIQSLVNVQNAIMSKNIKIYNPIDVFIALNRKLSHSNRFDKMQNYDANKMLNALLLNLNNILGKDLIIDLFRILFEFRILCKRCKNYISDTYIDFTIIVYCKLNDVNLEIERRILHEIFLGNFKCTRCNTNAFLNKEMVSLECPQYLQLIFLRKNNPDKKTVDRGKVTINQEFIFRSTNYKLQVINHHIDFGVNQHFLCYILKKDVWYRCSDTKIDIIDEKAIKRLLIDNENIVYALYKKTS